MKLALVIAALAVGIFLVLRAAKQESGFLWMSQAECARDFVRYSASPAVERFHRDFGRWPTSKEGLSVLLHAPEKDAARWRGPYLRGEEIPKDPWGREYRYRIPTNNAGFAYDVFSLGADGKISDDDISSTSK